MAKVVQELCQLTELGAYLQVPEEVFALVLCLEAHSLGAPHIQDFLAGDGDAPRGLQVLEKFEGLVRDLDEHLNKLGNNQNDWTGAEALREQDQL